MGIIEPCGDDASNPCNREPFVAAQSNKRVFIAQDAVTFQTSVSPRATLRAKYYSDLSNTGVRSCMNLLIGPGIDSAPFTFRLQLSLASAEIRPNQLTGRNQSRNGSSMQITKHKVVKIHYTLTDDDGEVIDTFRRRRTAGVPARCRWDRARPGERLWKANRSAIRSKSVYNRKMPTANTTNDLLHEVERSHFEGIDDLELGMQFQVDTDDGPMVVTVVEITDENVTVDGNHELAGVPLNFRCHRPRNP